MGITRRGFLTRVGQAGGYSATMIAMQSLGLMPAKALEAPNFAAAPGTGNGVKVVILGGGIAGLVAAYEMKALGYECTVLEARERPGGRNWSVRGGDKITFTDGTTQTCEFDAGHYQNVGPARLPSVHKTILGYCKKLGVELQVEVNTSRSSFLQNDAANGGKPVIQRQAINDTRGHVSELLMKCMKQGALDQEMDKTDRDKMLSFLRTYGSLDDAGKYKGGDRAGYKVLPGAGDQVGEPSDPIDMHTLLDESFWNGMLFEETFDMQATMFQPVGGMDRIPYAFAKALGDTVQYSSPVTEIRKSGKGVKIGYKQTGVAKFIEADYCICAMPLTILKKTPNDFAAPYKKVIEECTYASAYKVAWESRRFWEQDYNIYGGLEFVNTGCSPIWFPSANMFSERGVVVSGYTDESNSPFGKLAMPEKLVESRKSIERLHPGHGKELEKPIYVGWGKIPYNEGSWIRAYGPGQGRGPAATITRTGTPTETKRAATATNEGYETLIQPDGPIYFAGCHVSHIVAWQEGAALSSLRAVGLINDKVKAARA
ncbi:flavin monoamine oxidase family protein [Granulicella tundricola]|uniref:Tryptophan 2-monooxygenase n=1 Tax=Granulicella tundricola (strain ATCC BAA-1859 / DSM 23138 / MP5ACTX9) TaxID=1198114 RepID=E8WZ10_GRATM|nr:FAD-dependent oxidoreductase [Granulicella tundricola]ADW69925.1 L-amino-acid oxidase [Granulicella tundricola MP5ACTX9]